MSPKPFGFVIAPEYSTTVGRGGGAMMPTAEYIESRLPASEDAERAILGSITGSPEGYEIAVAMGLTAAEMSLTSHRHIYSAIAVMREAGRHVDLVTLTAELAERKQLETIGGVAYMSALLDAVPDWSNIR